MPIEVLSQHHTYYDIGRNSQDYTQSQRTTNKARFQRLNEVLFQRFNKIPQLPEYFYKKFVCKAFIVTL